MPYTKIAELPEGIKGLPTEAQRQFLRVVNSAMARGATEKSAFKQAWGAVKERFKQNAKGEWVKKLEDWRAFVPFAEREDGWHLYFPLGDVWHHRQKVTFTEADAQEMLANFKEHNVPNYDLPINVLHRDELGVYGNIADLRLADGEVQWKPQWIESKLEELKSKGYRFASPEIWWHDYQAVDGKDYNNVAMGIAITPRPRLGRATAVFSDGEWWEQEPESNGAIEILTDILRGLFAERGKGQGVGEERQGDGGAGYCICPECGHTVEHEKGASCAEIKCAKCGTKMRGATPDEVEAKQAKKKLKEDKMSEEFNEELAENIFERLWNKLTAKTEEGEPEPDPEPETQDFSEQLATLEEKLRSEFSVKLAEKEADIEALNAEKEKAEKEAREFSEKFAEEERQRRLAEFSETAKGLNVPVKAEEFGAILMLFHDADTSEGKAGYNKMITVIEALGNAEKMAALFAETGSDAVGSDPASKFDALIKKRREEAKESLADATVWVAQNHPDVYAEYDKATVRALRSKGAE